MSFVDDTQPFTPARRAAQLKLTQNRGVDPSRFDQASEPVTSDTGVPDSLIDILNKRTQGAALARSIAPTFGDDVQTPDPAVHQTGAAIAANVAPQLRVDFRPPPAL